MVLTQAHKDLLAKAGIDWTKINWQAIIAVIEAILAALSNTPKTALKAACDPSCTDDCCTLMTDAIQCNLQAAKDCMDCCCCTPPAPTP